MSNPTIAKFARRSTLIVLALAVFGVGLNSLDLVIYRGTDASTLRQIVATLPLVFYLAAIWMIHRAHVALARGEVIEVALSALLERLGACLFLGGLARVFGEPWILKFVLSIPGGWALFDVAAITVGCIGLLLFVLARPIRDAAAARAELAEFL